MTCPAESQATLLRRNFPVSDDPLSGDWRLLHRPRTCSVTAFDAAGDLLALGTVRGTVRIWDVHTAPALVRNFRVRPSSGSWRRGDPSEVVALDWAPNGRLLFVGFLDGLLVALDTDRGRLVDQVQCVVCHKRSGG